MESPQDVGPVLLLRVHKAPLLLSAPVGAVARDAWFCRWIQLSQPRGAPLRFPCYQWLEGAESLALRAGAGEQGDPERPAGVAPREEEGAALCGSRGPAAEGRAAGARGGTGTGGGSCFSALLTAPVRSQPRSPGRTTTPSSGSSARKSYRPGRTRTSEEPAALGSSGCGGGVEAVGTGGSPKGCGAAWVPLVGH